MGFQNAFNQALATVGVMAGGAKHLKQQHEAQVQADWNVASGAIEQGTAIRNEYADLKTNIENTENAKEIAGNKLDDSSTRALDYRMAHMNMETGQSTMTRGQKAYARRLENQANADFKAYQSYEQEAAKLQARKQGLQERLNMLGGRVQSMSKDVHAKLPENWQGIFKVKEGKK